MHLIFKCSNLIIPLISVLSTIKNIDELFIDTSILLDGFKGTNKEKREKELEIKIKNYEPFVHSSGDHITMLNVYNSTLNYIYNLEDRRKYCSEKNINIDKILKIDEIYYQIAGTVLNEGLYKKLQHLIIISELFEVQNSKFHTKILEEMKIEKQYNPSKFIMSGGNKNIIKSSNKFQTNKTNKNTKKQSNHKYLKNNNQKQTKTQQNQNKI